MKTLKDTIHQLTLPTPYAVGDVHTYLLEGEMLTLVDAGIKTKEAWKSLQVQLKQLGYRSQDVEQIILTHHHPDHMGLIEYFPHVRNVAAHPKLRPWLEREDRFFIKYEQFFEEMYFEAGVPSSYFHLLKGLRKPLQWSSQGTLSQELLEGDHLPGHTDWQVIETPGHAQSHLSFVRETDGAMIGGDHLLAHISSNPLLEPSYTEGEGRPKPLLQYRNSMQKLADYTIDTVYPGHGKRFGQVVELIENRLKRQEERAHKVLGMIEEAPLRAYEVCEKLFPKQMESQFGLTMSETIGQLDYLEGQHLVETTKEDRQKIYYVNR
ncbi:MBL fold metallo-hydrolase [Halobacillus amylolyticus]|uniref:MBL fold metallo-hydrolase n=1 Tax=Halobacillus amylolyticus TaxID=2932259 RepID=A0ABY4HBW6_9BACI|nr:MBL fold metallo-hydrolase [Halobacillus amylolyticus]UOR12385.1 MBL fold metallo-hydrolase [Halobacillus amylolyticus]